MKIKGISTLFFSLLLMACNGGGGSDERSRDFSASFAPIDGFVHSQHATLTLDMLDGLSSVTFKVKTKDINQATDLGVRHTIDYLQRNSAINITDRTILMTVFGLYQDFQNTVELTLEYANGQQVQKAFDVVTAAISDDRLPQNIDVTFRDPALRTHYFLLRSGDYGNLIMDSDGEIRWASPDVGENIRSSFVSKDRMIQAAVRSNKVYHIRWDGSVELHSIDDPDYGRSHHTIEKGKVGLLNTVALIDGGTVLRPESDLIEMTETGQVLKAWSMDDIFNAAITGAGEDPTNFVRSGPFDWFHMNGAIYDPSDDGILVSSRENFVAKIDYETHAIRWIMGDPRKAWYTDYPLSLQPLALTIMGNTNIGQHALSLSQDGSQLMMFNNGWGNYQLPNVGDDRGYSLVSIYEIDEIAMTATEVFSYDNVPQIYARICSSAYYARSGNIVVDFGGHNEMPAAIIQVITPSQEKLFEASLPRNADQGVACLTAHSAEEVALDSWVID